MCNCIVSTAALNFIKIFEKKYLPLEALICNMNIETILTFS